MDPKAACVSCQKKKKKCIRDLNIVLLKQIEALRQLLDEQHDAHAEEIEAYLNVASLWFRSKGQVPPEIPIILRAADIVEEEGTEDVE
jgi:hypothetical protein